MLLGAASVTVPLTAQTGKVTLDSPQFDELPSPDVEGNTGLKNFKPKDWLEVEVKMNIEMPKSYTCLLYRSPSPRDKRQSRMPSSA